MKKLFLLTTAVLSLASAAFAQKENNVWVFGDHLGLDFNSGTPVFTQTSIATLGGSASVCDPEGHLLFYTQGDTIWNKNNQVMPNGSGLIAPYASNDGTQSSQGQLIIPVIGDVNKYYVFSMESTRDYLFNGDPGASRLFYSVVDMSLNGGMGDVVAGQKGIIMDSVLTAEKMIAIAGDSCSIWLLVHRIDGPVFRAYKISNTGLNLNPVVSNSGNMNSGFDYALGKMKASPDGKKIVTANFMLGLYGLELYDFNTATGAVSNAVVLDSIPQGISACFSPDGSKLYYFNFGADAQQNGNGAMMQYDLSQPTTAAIIASMTPIDSNHAPGASVYDGKVGPDGKLYVSMPLSNTGVYADTISVVNNPNAAGLACNYQRAALISPLPISIGNGDLPNTFVRPKRDTAFINTDTTLTLTGNVVLHAQPGFDKYTWSTGDTTATITISDTGTYWVRGVNYCSVTSDTFRVKPFVGVHNVVAASGLLVYPNPAASVLTIAIKDNFTGTAHITLTDVLGKTALSLNTTEKLIHADISTLTPGMYVLSYTTDENNSCHHVNLIITR